MPSYTVKERTQIFSYIASGFVLGAMVFSTVFASDPILNQDGDGDVIKVTYPSVDCVTLNSNCSVEAAAYATAVANLEAAEEVADDAYDAWLECEGMNTRDVPRFSDPGPSVLTNIDR